MVEGRTVPGNSWGKGWSVMRRRRSCLEHTECFTRHSFCRAVSASCPLGSKVACLLGWKALMSPHCAHSALPSGGCQFVFHKGVYLFSKCEVFSLSRGGMEMCFSM